MSQLLDTLENKVFTAVETIETLRTEVHDLKEERRQLENKLRELITKIDALSAKDFRYGPEGKELPEDRAEASPHAVNAAFKAFGNSSF